MGCIFSHLHPLSERHKSFVLCLCGRDMCTYRCTIDTREGNFHPDMAKYLRRRKNNMENFTACDECMCAKLEQVFTRYPLGWKENQLYFTSYEKANFP
nr:hypothetical protein Clen_455 [Cedratvirus lena]WIL04975.1 hypothetical protein Cduv_495 [Cedratvirus duvanny]